MAEIGMLVIVEAKSNLGRHLVNQFGKIWEIIKLANEVPHDSRKGDWALLRGGEVDGYQQWCLLCRDNHLTVIDVKQPD